MQLQLKVSENDEESLFSNDIDLLEDNSVEITIEDEEIIELDDLEDITIEDQAISALSDEDDITEIFFTQISNPFLDAFE